MIESQSSVSSYEIKKGVWKSISKQHWKKGRYTKEEEDELIIEKVAEAKKNTSMSKICSGLWVSIGKELNREPE